MEMVFGKPDLQRIEELYAFIASDAEGEGLCGFQTPDGQWMPMVAADKARVDSLRRIASMIASKTGQRIKLCRFKIREELEVIEDRDIRS